MVLQQKENSRLDLIYPNYTSKVIFSGKSTPPVEGSTSQLETIKNVFGANKEHAKVIANVSRPDLEGFTLIQGYELLFLSLL